MSDLRFGLVLEGGGMRGMFTAGVLDAWMDAGVRFDGLAGVSAGACFGCNFKSGQRGRVLRYNLRFARDWRYCSWRSWWKTGDLFGGDFCFHRLPETLDPFDCAAFARNPMEFHAVGTDVETAQPVYWRLERGDWADCEKIRASSSMPLVARAVEIDGRPCLDGGLSDAIPLAYFERCGFSRNVVVTTRAWGYRKEKSRGTPFLRWALRRHPALAASLEGRHERYNAALDHIADAVRDGRALVVAPPEPLEIHRICHAPALIERTYRIGFQAGVDALPRLGGFARMAD